MASANPSADFRYAAFISYRHAPVDRQWAVWLHTALETYRTPHRLVKQGASERIGRVFRDEEEVAASADLSETIESALRQSRFLIVVCSPRCAQSAWVNREVEYFRGLGREDQILSLLIEGEPTDAFPPALVALRQEGEAARAPARAREPLAADVRPQPGERTSTLRKTALLRMAATILGLHYDDLRQREHERSLRRAIWFSAVACALLGVVSLLALFAWVQRNYAVNVAAANQQLAADKGDLLTAANRELENRHIRQGMDLVDQGDHFSALPWLMEAFLKADASRHAIHRVRLAAVLNQTPQLVTAQFFEQPVYDVEFSPAGSRFLVVSGACRVYDIAKPTDPLFSVELPGGISGANFSPDGKALVAFSNALAKDRGGNRVFQADSGAPITAHLNIGRPIGWSRIRPDGQQVAARGNAPENFYGLAVNAIPGGETLNEPVPGEIDPAYLLWSPDGQSLFTTGHEQQEGVHKQYARLWRRQENAWQKVLDAAVGVEFAAFSGDGQRLAVCFTEGAARVVDCQSGQTVGPVIQHPRKVRQFDLDHSGHRLLTVNEDNRAFANSEAERRSGEAIVWDVASGKQLLNALRHDGEDVHHAEFSSECELILTRSETQARVWRSATGTPVTPPIRHRAQLYSAALSPDARYLLTSGAEGSVRLWDLAYPSHVSLAPEGNPGRTHSTRSARFLPTSHEMVLNSFWSIRTWDVATLAPRTESLLDPTDRFSLSADGQRLAIAQNNNDWQGPCQVVVVDPKTDDPAARLGDHPSRVSVLAFDAKATRLLVGGMAGQFEVWDVASNQPLLGSQKLEGEITAGCLSSDGSIAFLGIKTPDSFGQVVIWNLAEKREQARASFGGTISALLVADQDRELIVTGGNPWGPGGNAVGSKGLVARYQASTGAVLGEPYTQPGFIRFAAMQPAGRLLAIASNDRTVKLLYCDDLQPAKAQLRHEVGVNSLAWSDDGALLLTAAGDPAPAWRPGQARLWESETGLPVTPWLSHALEVHDAALAPDLSRIVTCGDDLVKVWKLGSRGESLLELSLVCQFLSASRVDPVLGLTPLSPEELKTKWNNMEIAKQWEPSNAGIGDWHRAEALLAEQAGQWRVLRRHLDALLQEVPRDFDLRLRRAMALNELEAWAEAEADFTAYLEQRESAPARRARAHARRSLGNRSGALEDLNAALAKSDGLAWGEIGDCYSDRGWLHTESDNLPQARADFDQALAPIYQTQMSTWSHWRALYGRGRINLVEGQLDEAEADFSEAIDWAEESANARQMAMLRYFHAAALILTNEDEEALEELALAEKDGYSRLDVWRERNTALSNLGRHAEALEVIQAARKLAPADGEWAASEAQSLAELSQFSVAAERFGEAVRLGNKNAQTRAEWLLASLAAEQRDTATGISADLLRHWTLLEDPDDLATVLEAVVLALPPDAAEPLAAAAEKLQQQAEDEPQLVIAAAALVRGKQLPRAAKLFEKLEDELNDEIWERDLRLWQIVLLVEQGVLDSARREFAVCQKLLATPLPDDASLTWRDRVRHQRLAAELEQRLKPQE